MLESERTLLEKTLAGAKMVKTICWSLKARRRRCTGGWQTLAICQRWKIVSQAPDDLAIPNIWQIIQWWSQYLFNVCHNICVCWKVSNTSTTWGSLPPIFWKSCIIFFFYLFFNVEDCQASSSSQCFGRLVTMFAFHQPDYSTLNSSPDSKYTFLCLYRQTLPLELQLLEETPPAHYLKNNCWCSLSPKFWWWPSTSPLLNDNLSLCESYGGF